MEQSERVGAGLVLRSARIWSGLFLLLFVTSHLLNLSLGVISLEVMDAARPYLSEIWATPVLGPLLFAALVVHFLLGLLAIYRRPTLQTGVQDMVQLFSGVIVVPLLATHVVSVAALKINGVSFGYAEAVQFFWLMQPSIGLLQVVLLSVVWIHGCAGLFTWLRSREGMRNALNWIYPVAVAIPVLALLGFAGAGRGVLIEASNAGGAAAAPAMTPPASPTVPFEMVQSITSAIIWGSLALAALTFVARAMRLRLQSYQAVTLQRGDAAPIRTRSSLSVLDSFKHHHQPHANLCAGRGRCGTCAVRVLMSEFPLPAPGALEQKTLHRIGADADVRLACQLHPPGGFLEMEPIYPADYSFRDDDYAEAKPSADQTNQTGATA